MAIGGMSAGEDKHFAFQQWTFSLSGRNAIKIFHIFLRERNEINSSSCEEIFLLYDAFGGVREKEKL